VHGGIEGCRAAVADLVRVDNLLRLVGRRPRRLRVAGRDRDLDLRRQVAETEQRLLRVLQLSRDPGDGGIDLALREAEERKPRLRLAAELVRHPVRLLGTREVAPTPADLADLVMPERRDRAVEVVQLLAGRQRLSLCGRPVAPEPEHLGAMNAAGTRKAGDVELVAEAVRGLRPLGRATDVAEVLAGADRDAVHEPGGVCAEIAAHRGCRRLVEERKPFVDLPFLDECSSLPREGEHLHVTVTNPFRELVRLLEQRDGPVVVALGEHRSERVDEAQPSVLGRLRKVLEQAFRIREPASGDGKRAARLVVPRERQCHAGGTELVAGSRIAGVGALAVRDRLVELPAPPRGFAVVLEVGGRQLRVGDARVGAVGHAPGLTARRGACFTQRVDDLRHPRDCRLLRPVRQCG
jgi:hypothetical protein